MLCPPLPPVTAAQVWPGSGIDIFTARDGGVTLRVVSGFSRFLNSERWYFGTAPSGWGEELHVQYGLGAAGSSAVLDGSGWSVSESYFDRAVLTSLDWVEYKAPRSAPYGYQTHTFKGTLMPVLVIARGDDAPLVDRAKEPIDVWLQFWTLSDTLLQLAWSFSADAEIRWQSGGTGFPSAFEIPEKGCAFEKPKDGERFPAHGWTYAGGLRPAPWVGTDPAELKTR